MIKRTWMLCLAMAWMGCEVGGTDPFGAPSAGWSQEHTSAPGETATASDVATDGSDTSSSLQDAVEAPWGWCDRSENLASVIWVIDGDTVELSDGSRIRYIGVDAPELSGSDCWSSEARDRLMEMTPMGYSVCLLADTGSEDVDPWGRLLRYVYVLQDGRWVMQNERLVRSGSARAFHKYLHGKDYADAFVQAEIAAQSDRLGGWGQCPDWED
jgi:micrococcal nuclease